VAVTGAFREAKDNAARLTGTDYNGEVGRGRVREGAMTKGKHLSRKTSRIVRTPATRFPHLRKRMTKVGKGLARVAIPPKK
jgi:hypothetical protein